MYYKFRDTTPINTDPVTVTGEIVTVDTSDEITDLVGVVTTIEPIQSGSGTPSPSNIRPISGHTECVTSVSGVNVWDEEWRHGYYNSTTGVYTSATTFVATKNTIKVLPNTTYWFESPFTFRFVFRDASGNLISIRERVPRGEFTTPNDCYGIDFNSYNGGYGDDYQNDISINYPSTDHEYHAYNGNTYTTDLGRTVYGGTLEVVSGKLVVDRVAVDMGSVNWTYRTNSAKPYFFFNATGMARATPLVCSCYEQTTYAPNNANSPNGSIYNASYFASATNVIVRDERYTNASELQTALSGQTLVYELATPQTYQLTPQEVELLLGTNNLWTDCGSVSVTTKKTIDRVWLPSEAVSVDGQYLENVVDGYRTLYTKGRESLAVELDTYSVGTADGETYKSKRYPARTIKVGFQLIAPDNYEFRRRFNQLNNLLSLDEADFIFNDETDKFFAGIPRFNCEVDAGENSVKGEWEIYCVYPFKRTVNPVTLTMSDADVTNTSATFTIDYKGGQPARPVLRAKFAGAKSGGDSSEDGDCGFVAFMDADENIIQLGNPDVIDRDQYTSAVTLINKEFVNATGWTGSATIRNITDTYWLNGKGQTQSYASLGTISKVTEGAVDLKVSLVHRLCINNAGQTGTFGVRCKDANNNVVCGFQIRKTGNGTTARVEYIAGGNVIGADNIDISYYNTHFGYCNRTPVYVQETYTVPTTQTTKIQVKTKKKKKKKKYKTITKTVWVKKVRTVQRGWNYTQSNLNSMFVKDGDVITFDIGNLPARTYKAPSVSESVATTIELFGTGNFHTNAVHSLCFRREAGTPFAEKPNVFTAGDVVEADCNDATVQIYRDGSVGGTLEPQYGALGNDWEAFTLNNGMNVIRAVWSDWVNPTYKPSIEIEYNEVFI